MVPMCPAACTDGLVGLIAWFNAHVRHPALELPFRELLSNEVLDDSFTPQVFRCYGTEFVIKLFSGPF